MHLRLTWLNEAIGIVEIPYGMNTRETFNLLMRVGMASNRALQRVELVWGDTGTVEREWNNPVA